MFSKELELSIAALFDKAHEANIQYITVEHLLLMIMSDFDVKEFFKSKGISIDSLKDDLNNHLNKNVVSKIDQQKPVQPTLGFQRVLQRAVFHIQSSGKGVVKPINIKEENLQVFHSGTKINESKELVTNGGRVLSIVCQNKDFDSAFEKAYEYLDKVKFKGISYRKDIGHQVRESYKGERN